MNDIQIFNNPQFGEVRVSTAESGEPMFCAADVCKALGYVNPRKATADHVDEGDVTKRDAWVTTGAKADGTPAQRQTEMTFVNESGLYALIFGSRLEGAKAFKKWVTSEVLPSIRKTGGYIATKADDTPEMIMARAVLVAQATIEKQSKQIAEQSAKIEADAPKVLFAESLRAADRSILVGELAKILKQNGYETGQKRLFQWLRDNGYLMKSGTEKNQPTQRSMEMGLFEMSTRTIAAPDGLTIAKVTTKVTVKGQQYFISKLTAQQP